MFRTILFFLIVSFVRAQNGTQICVVAMDSQNCVQMVTLTIGSSQTSISQLSCFQQPTVSPQFTWGWSIDPVNEYAWVMGIYPQSNSVRTLLGIQYQTGETVYSVTEGPAASGQNSPYYFASDPSTNTTYALWETASNTYPIVEIDLATGAAKVLANFTMNDNCYPALLLIANMGQWDAFRRAYVTPWDCTHANYLVRYYVDTGEVSAVQVSESPNYIGDFGVDLFSGATYVMMTNGGGTTQQTYVVGGSDEAPELLLILSTDYFDWPTLFALPNGVCVVAPSKGNTNVICQVAFNQSWSSTIPQTSNFDSLIAPHFVRCPGTAAL